MLSIKSCINPISAGAFALFILSGCMSTTSQTSKVSNGYNEYSNAPIGCPQSETSKALGEAAEVIGLIADLLTGISDTGSWQKIERDRWRENLGNSVKPDCP